MTRLASWLVVAVLVAAGSLARADTATAEAPPPSSLVLPQGKLLLDVYLEMSLSSNAVFSPVSLAPDLWYGLTDAWTLGLVHSTAGATGFIGVSGDSLCLTGTSDGCQLLSGRRHRCSLPSQAAARARCWRLRTRHEPVRARSQARYLWAMGVGQAHVRGSAEPVRRPHEPRSDQ